MIRIHRRHNVQIRVATEHHFTDYPELSTLGKWLETEGNHWSCLSLVEPNAFIANLHQITGWQEAAVFEANHCAQKKTSPEFF